MGYIELGGLAHGSITGTFTHRISRASKRSDGVIPQPLQKCSRIHDGAKTVNTSFRNTTKISSKLRNLPTREDSCLFSRGSRVEDNIDDSEAKEFEGVFMEADDREEQSWEDETACDEDMNSDEV